MIDISKFDFIEELPVSEEMLGAFLEGSLMGAEVRDVSNFVESNSIISDLINELEVDNVQIDSFGGNVGTMYDPQMAEFNEQIEHNDIVLPTIEIDRLNDVFTNYNEIASSNIGNEIYESTEASDQMVISENESIHIQDNEINL